MLEDAWDCELTDTDSSVSGCKGQISNVNVRLRTTLGGILLRVVRRVCRNNHLKSKLIHQSFCCNENG